MGTAVRRSSRLGIESYAVVYDLDHVVGFGAVRVDTDRAAACLSGHAVAHRVLHEGLDGQGRDVEILTADGIDDVELLAEAGLFDLQIAPDVPHLLLKGDELLAGEGVQILPQELGKIQGQGLCPFGGDIAHGGDGREGVIHEVRVDL